jgi:ComF family protein
MRKFLRMLSDICFPPGEDEVIVRTLTGDDMDELFHEVSQDDWTALSLLKDLRVRALIHEAKFRGNADAHALLGGLIRTWREHHPELVDAVFIPVPLSRERLRARGYNQVELVLRASDVRPLQNALVRVRHTRPQTELSREERLANVTGAFAASLPETLYGKDIVIVDDVVTTGATLRAVALTVRRHNPRSVTCLALSH